MSADRYSRHELFFGKDGQEMIGKTKYAIVGLGGTGSHLAQQLAYLGGKDYRVIDGDRLDPSSLNRVVTARPSDLSPPRLKVEVAERLVREVQPGSKIEVVPKSFVTEEGFAAIRSADVVFGCVDRDSARLILNEFCQAYTIPYVDIATDIDKDNPRQFGGRYHFSVDGERCVFCDDLLDQDAIRHDFENKAQRLADERIYGVPRSALAGTGPSVVSLNGLLVSAALMEFMVDLTGLRKAKRWLQYSGFWGTLAAVNNPAKAHCPYCKGSLIRGRGKAANVERYIAIELARQVENVLR